MNTNKAFPFERWFWCLIGFHLILWTLMPTLIRFGLPMDSLENTMLAQQLQAGYDKHPWLTVWIFHGLTWLTNQDWIIYFASQCFVTLTLWSVWTLGRKIFHPAYAFLGVFMLEAIQYYSIASIDFNNNTMELSLWALLSLVFYLAITKNKLRHWLGLGLIAGLALMAKYHSFLTILAMLTFMIYEPKAREQFKHKGFYLALLITLVVITPHILWVINHDFITINYALDKVEDTPTWYHHITHPLNFFFIQLSNVLGALVLFCFLFLSRNKTPTIATKSPISAFNKRFLWIVGAGPLVITCLSSVIGGWKIHTMWGIPLLSLSGLIILIYLQPDLTAKRIKYFIAGVVFVMILFATGYTISLTKPGTHSSANYPGQAIAQQLEALWHSKYKHPLPIVAGNLYTTSYVARYGQDKPQVFIDWKPEKNQWLTEAEVKEKGAIFTTTIDQPGQGFPPEIRKTYPNLGPTQVYYFKWHRAKNGQAPAGIIAAILPPAGKS